jgi:hypothetical protein
MKTYSHIRRLTCSVIKPWSVLTKVALTLVILFAGCGKNAENSENVSGPDTPLTKADTARSIRENQESVTPLPKELVAAWTEAGAEVGWTTNMAGFVAFRAGSEGKKNEVPAFRFSEWRAGVLSKLPQPQQAFGLSLAQTKVTDTGLRACLESQRSCKPTA